MPSTSSPLARSTPMPSVNLSPRATGGPIDPFDTVDEPEFSEFSELALLPYLAGIPYPTYLLPSPRLSSSSEPSLSALWSNDSAQELGPDLNAILPYRDSRRLKALIASSDQADDEQWATSEANEKHETTSLASFSSFVLASQNTIELDVILPRWSKRRPYSATLQPSAHPSFFVLLLVPAKARNPKPKSFLDTSHSLASSIVDPAETFLAVDSSTAELGGEDESGTSGGKAQPAVSVPLEWTSLRDQGPVTKVLEEVDYHWSYREAEARMDWSRTPIGYPKQWHPTLRTMMNCIETMPDLGAIWWFLPDQDDWFMLHNSVYETALRNPTGAHFGRYASDSWGGENWETLKARAHECQNSGQGIYTDDDAFYLNSIETYMSWRWSPIIGPKGEKLGILVTAFIDTQKVIARRYLETSRTLASNLASSRSIQELSEGLLKSLELNERDFPYAMLYHLRTETATGKKCDLTTEGTVFLAGSVGLPFDHSICPRQAVLNLSTNSSPSGTESAARWPLASALEEAFHSENPIRLTELAVEVPEDMRQRSWGDIPYSAMVYKISNLGESSGRCSFLVLGMNPRRPFDSQYSNWLDAIQRHILLTYRNISYLEDEKRKRAELASLDQAKTNFFASASHELRTPLQLILGPLTELENSETTATRKGYFALIQRSGARLMRLVDSILDFSKMESGQLNGHFSPRNLGILSGDVAEVFRSSIEKARIEFNVSCARESDKLVYIDTSFWEKICYNLIGNAFKYTLKGSIEVSCTYHPDEFEFRVTDTGVGIPKSDLGKVTERFHRVQSVSRSVEGTGIGLALCAELVQLLGGRLEIESSTAAESPTNESGSVFSVFLPYGKGHLPDGQIDDDENREAYLCSDYSRGLLEEASRWAGRGANTSGSSGTAATSLSDSGVSTSESSKVDLNTLFWAQNDVILLVDDSQDLLEYLSTILARHCKIIQASNGEEAVKVLQKQSVNLVVSDVQMPTMDGYALLAAIRAHKDPERAITPVILISARAGEEERVGGLLAGADDFLPKPFSAKELVARCHLQVQLGKRRLELERNFRAESATTRLLSDLSPVGISRWNPDGLPVYANPAWYKQSGHPPDASLASWMDSVHPDHHSVMHKMSEQLFDKKAAVEGEWMWTNGTWSYCQAVIIDKHSNSNYEGMICVLTDITERKKYETERKIAVAAEEAHLRHRAEFAEEKKREADEQKRHQEFLVSVVSHEVRNPVSAILQCAGLCRANLSFFRNELATSLQSSQPFEPTSELVNLLDEDIETLDNVTETALLIERIANDFLSLGKIQLATLEIFATPCDLSAEVRKLLGVFASEARLKGIHIALDLKGQLGDPNGQHIFLTDPVRLGQVVINLLSNAIRFTSASERREISVALEVSASPPSSDNCKAPVSSKPFTPGGKSYIYGAVTDSGPGLAPESLSILFQRFQQASSSTHTVFGGSGLGLYVCRLITGLMNGRIEVDSVKGEGSTFRFFIECMTPDEAGDIAQTVDVKPIVIQFPHVLVVEDNLINARVIERQLKKAGMTCSVTYDGQQGLDAVVKSFKPGEKRFNCILMDCEMPVMDGVTAVKHIRRLEAKGSLPTRSKIFALTGNARQGQIDDALKAGMDDVVLKPYKVDLLLEKLRTFSQLV